jgi:hypothetical protein
MKIQPLIKSSSESVSINLGQPVLSSTSQPVYSDIGWSLSNQNVQPIPKTLISKKTNQTKQSSVFQQTLQAQHVPSQFLRAAQTVGNLIGINRLDSLSTIRNFQANSNKNKRAKGRTFAEKREDDVECLNCELWFTKGRSIISHIEHKDCFVSVI